MKMDTRSQGSASHTPSQSHKAAEEILLLSCRPQVLGTFGREAMPSSHPLHCHGHPPGYGYLGGAEVYIVASARLLVEESLISRFS